MQMNVVQSTCAVALITLAAIHPLHAESPEYWRSSGREAVARAKQTQPVGGRAKNVILFVGDGMGITTVTAARILDGQNRGGRGEENLLSFERLPYVALSKTYSANQQTPDSAPTMSAMMTGVKTNDGFLSVNERGVRRDWTTVKGNETQTLLEQAEIRGMATGVVTTTRVTHATPAACYAHTVDRDWEADADQPATANSAGFPDIARQLIEFPYGDGPDVVLGGGRAKFLPEAVADPEYPKKRGERKDGRNLVSEWIARRANSAYVWNQAQFDAVDPARITHLLGLFEPSHLHYEADRKNDAAGEPSLAEMTGKALDVLSRSDKGFFLMVEGGRIDHGHHAGNAYRALTDAIEFSRAVQVALDRTKEADTLIIVTADHSHTLTMAGYPKRGNPILGKVVEPGHADKDYARDLLGLPYTTLSYANGPGYDGESADQHEGPKHFPHGPRAVKGITSGRPDLTNVDTASADYLQESTAPLESETHGGEDVPIYARGPMAHLFHGVLEQHVIYHVMADALGF
jgi:alkaline phosphatase